jgi:hypothetical protein
VLSFGQANWRSHYVFHGNENPLYGLDSVRFYTGYKDADKFWMKLKNADVKAFKYLGLHKVCIQKTPITNGDLGMKWRRTILQLQKLLNWLVLVVTVQMIDLAQQWRQVLLIR